MKIIFILFLFWTCAAFAGKKQESKNQECHSEDIKKLKFNELKFAESPTEIKKFKSEDSDFTLFRAGEVSQGLCKGAEYLVMEQKLQGSCGKRTEPISFFPVLSDNFPEYQERRSFVNECYELYRLIKVKNSYYVERKNYPYIKNLEKEIKGSRVTPMKGFDFKSLLLPISSINWKGEKVSVKISENSWIEDFCYKCDKRVRKPKNFLVVFDDKSIGRIRVYGRRSMFLAKDATYFEVTLGTLIHKEGYAFTGFFEKAAPSRGLKKGDFKDVGTYKVLKDPQHSYFKKGYQDYEENLRERLAHLKAPQKEMSFLQYVNSQPLIVIVDPLGRWQVFRSIVAKIPIMAEPLVYFYSHKPIEVQFSISDQVTLLESVPKYKNGWKLRTKPPDQFMENRSKRTFRTLFWEGHSYITPKWDQGWVVASHEMSAFLDRRLKEFGLIQREIKDFKRYWLPRLNASPYYKVRFFDSRFLKTYAPLHIQPWPDTLIRVHMEALPLSHFQNMPAPQQIAPQKRGPFTVVEWSGFTYEKIGD